MPQQTPKIACFYPWRSFEPSGAWTRFTCLWKYLLSTGAHVTLVFFESGRDVTYGNLSVVYIGGTSALNMVFSRAKSLVAADSKSELRQFSETELRFLLLYEKGLFLGIEGFEAQLDAVVRDQDIVTCEYPMFAGMLSDVCRKAFGMTASTRHFFQDVTARKGRSA